MTYGRNHSRLSGGEDADDDDGVVAERVPDSLQVLFEMRFGIAADAEVEDTDPRREEMRRWSIALAKREANRV